MVETVETNTVQEITQKDVTKTYLRWHFANEIPHAFDRYISPSLLYAMMPILKKLYPDVEKRKEAYKRQLLFFNTQLSWGGGVITGLMSSMESARAEQEAKNEEITMTDDLMYNTKAGLMGALAGIGDAIDSGTVQYIFIAMAVPWAQQGSALGALFPFICFAIYQFAIGLFFARQSFKMGRDATSLMADSSIKKVIEFLSVLGLFMMGILAGSYIKLSSSMKFTLSGKEFVIQELLDKIVPGILPLAAVWGIYWFYRKRGLNVMKAMLWLTAVLVVLATVGIL